MHRARSKVHGSTTARRRNLPGMNAQNTAITAAKPIKVRKIRALSAKIKRAIELKVVYGLSGDDAAKAAGVSTSGLWKALSLPQGEEWAKHLQSDTDARIKAKIGAVTLKALAVAEKLLDDDQDRKTQAKMVELFRGESRAVAAVQVNNHVTNAAPAGYSYARPDTMSAADHRQVIDGKAKDVTPE